ncbi:hypothetical protein PIB30_026859 [Stylosanthes scabra]|uniref:Uncharacterized protein n=1 Tax=Stylosanthes scabra TaxID=79078 RepID=A0ABU6SAP1_9FABA|nr:hypothetical protein [Stylosanthes scabra]
MGDIQFTNPLLDKHDHQALHMTDSQEQRDRQLGFSFPLPTRIWSQPNPHDCIKKEDKIIGSAIENDPGANAIVTILGPSESSNTSCSGKAREGEEEEEVHPISTFTASSTSSIDTYLSNEREMIDDDDVDMDAFYASIDVAGVPMLSNSHQKLVTATPSDEEIRKALRSVQDLLSNDDSNLLYPKLYIIRSQNSAADSTLDYLSELSAHHGVISRETSKVISEASRFLIYWSRDCSKASTKIDSIMSQLQRADELEMSLESNKKMYLEIVASRERKTEIFEEGNKIKAELDEIRKNMPQWEQEYTLAKKTQANIIAEWSRLQEKFQNIEKDLNL